MTWNQQLVNWKRLHSRTQTEDHKKKTQRSSKKRKTTTNITDHTDNNTETDDQNAATGKKSLLPFSCCEVPSLDEAFQQATCSRLNLCFFPDIASEMSPSQTVVAQQLQCLMHRKTAASVSVNVATISGDGNCLFRALSHAVTRSQEQHDLLRLYVTNYMANSEIAQKLKQLFANGDRPDVAHESHILTMQQSGQWAPKRRL